MSAELDSFLRDLRELRERRGLSVAELAARTHFPIEVIAAAETGPARPALPVVEAYARACGGDPDDWEDRWRTLPTDFVVITSPGSPTGRRLPFPWLGVAVAAVALVGGGSAALALSASSHQTPRAASTYPTVPSRSSSPAPGTSSPVVPPPRATTSAAPSPARTRATPPAARGGRPTGGASPTSAPVPTRPATLTTTVTGVGCPQGAGDGVTVDNTAKGPGWNDAGGGWTGNGCDGSSVWTKVPNGKGSAAAALTWFFAPAAADTHCALSVFVPDKNASGTAYYAIDTGDQTVSMVSVDQASDTGQWVTLGTYQVTGGTVQIQLSADLATLTAVSTAGNGHGHGNDAIAASAASASCG